MLNKNIEARISSIEQVRLRKFRWPMHLLVMMLDRLEANYQINRCIEIGRAHV